LEFLEIKIKIIAEGHHQINHQNFTVIYFDVMDPFEGCFQNKDFRMYMLLIYEVVISNFDFIPQCWTASANMLSESFT
jgi:hypothetical protein